MNKMGLLVVAGAFALVIGGCSETKDMLGLTKKAPDEFAVYSRPPLSLPPNYSLRPPSPGRDRPQIIEPRDLAIDALLDSTALSPAARESAGGGGIEASPGVRAFWQSTGVPEADPDIRAIINRETTFLAEEDITAVERIMFWGVQTEYGTVVNAQGEAERIRQNMALGRPITEGETPIIERRRKAILDGIFN